MPPTKDEILANLRAKAANREVATFNFATMPEGISVEDIALELQKLTGRNVYPALKTRADKKEVVTFPFNKEPVQPSTAPVQALPGTQAQLGTPDNSVVTSNAAPLQGGASPFTMPTQGQQEPEQPAPSIGARFKAGFMGKEVPQPKGFDVGDVAQFAGENIMPAGGAALGALSTAPTWLPTGMSSAMAGGMAGAAAGRAAQNAIAEPMKTQTDRKSALGLLADPVLASLEYGLGEGLVNKLSGKAFLGKGLKKLAPHGRGPTGKFLPPERRELTKAEDVAASWLEKGPGIDPQNAEAVVRDPEILWRAGPLKDVRAEYGKWMKGLRGRVERSKAFFGEETPTFARIKKVLPAIEESAQMNHAHGSKLYLESLLTAREQIAMQMEKGMLGDPEQKVLRKYWQEKIAFFDKAIERERPGYARLRKMYNEAKINQEFNNVLPIEHGLHTTNVNKAGAMGASVAGGITGMKTGHPVLGALAIGGAVAMSPLANKAAILSLAGAKRLANVALTAKLPASMTAALLRETIKHGKTPEEKNQIMAYIVQQKKTQPPIAGERPIEETLTEVQNDPAGLYIDVPVDTDEEGGLF